MTPPWQFQPRAARSRQGHSGSGESPARGSREFRLRRQLSGCLVPTAHSNAYRGASPSPRCLAIDRRARSVRCAAHRWASRIPRRDTLRACRRSRLVLLGSADQRVRDRVKSGVVNAQPRNAPVVDADHLHLSRSKTGSQTRWRFFATGPLLNPFAKSGSRTPPRPSRTQCPLISEESLKQLF